MPGAGSWGAGGSPSSAAPSGGSGHGVPRGRGEPKAFGLHWVPGAGAGIFASRRRVGVRLARATVSL